MKKMFLVLAVAALAAWAAPARAADEAVLSDQAIDARIQKYRTAEATLTVNDAAGKPLANAEVVVTMQRHKFLFGCNLARWGELKDPQLEADYRRRFAELLNYATLPFFHWGTYEPVQGQTHESQRRAVAEWCCQQGIRTKGHALVCHEWQPEWLKDLDVKTLRRLQLARVEREVKAFAGLIDLWDVANEVISTAQTPKPIGRLCKEMGAVELVSAAFDAARKANPKAVLVLNENHRDEKFVDLLTRSLAAKAPIDAIGIQSHMHYGYWGSQRLWDICERFGHFGKPLHWTETTLVSGRLMKKWGVWDDPVKDRDTTTPEGEKRQAEEVVEYYRVLFSHPAVEAITWWDFSDNGSWMSAPAGLVRQDMSPKPAYDALKKLIKGRWWTGPLKLTTDATGRATFRGYLGDYQLRSGAAIAEFRLDAPGKVAAAATARVATDAKVDTERR